MRPKLSRLIRLNVEKNAIKKRCLRTSLGQPKNSIFPFLSAPAGLTVNFVKLVLQNYVKDKNSKKCDLGEFLFPQSEFGAGFFSIKKKKIKPSSW